MYKVYVLKKRGTFFVEICRKWYRVDQKYKIGRRLITFYNMAEVRHGQVFEVPIPDEADLYKLIPTKRGKEIIGRYIEQCKRKESTMKEDSS